MTDPTHKTFLTGPVDRVPKHELSTEARELYVVGAGGAVSVQNLLIILRETHPSYNRQGGPN